MDTVTLVNKYIDDGERLIKQLPQEGFEVTAAFWLKASEDDEWDFYLVSPVVEAEGLAQAYRQLHPLIRRMPQPFWLDPLEVKLIGPADPIAQDVLGVQSRAGGPPGYPIRWGGKKLGNVSIEEAYFYPLPGVVPG